MKVLYFILFFLHSTFSIGQIDTLIIDSGSMISSQDLIEASSTHKLRITLLDCCKGEKENKIMKKYLKKMLPSLNKILPEVKVLYLINPTLMSEIRNDSSMTVSIDTLCASLYKLNFAKMTSLNVVYVIGDDTDYIVDFPSAFYSTPVKTVHYCQIEYGETLTRNIKKKKKEIDVIRETAEDRDYYIRFLNEQ